MRQLTNETQWDVRNAGAYDHSIVYEAGGQLKTLDVANGQIQPIPIHLELQSQQARPQWKDAAKTITSARLSPSGKRVLITARGDVFSVPAKEGSVRNLTATSGIRESDALWSKDGQRISYLSDEGGIQSLVIRDAKGLQSPARHVLGKMGYFTLLGWAPDARRIVFQDNHLRLYAIDLSDGAVKLIDSSPRRNPFKVEFSPDGQWIAYTVVADNYFTRVRLHSFAAAKNYELADSFIQTDSPVFGSNDLLYFTASIDAGPTRVSLDMSTQERPLRMAIYAAVLSASGHSPLPPKSGDEDPKGKDKESDKDKDNNADKADKSVRQKSLRMISRINLSNLLASIQRACRSALCRFRWRNETMIASPSARTALCFILPVDSPESPTTLRVRIRTRMRTPISTGTTSRTEKRSF